MAGDREAQIAASRAGAEAGEWAKRHPMGCLLTLSIALNVILIWLLTAK